MVNGKGRREGALYRGCGGLCAGDWARWAGESSRGTAFWGEGGGIFAGDREDPAPTGGANAAILIRAASLQKPPRTSATRRATSLQTHQGRIGVVHAPYQRRYNLGFWAEIRRCSDRGTAMVGGWVGG